MWSRWLADCLDHYKLISHCHTGDVNAPCCMALRRMLVLLFSIRKIQSTGSSHRQEMLTQRWLKAGRKSLAQLWTNNVNLIQLCWRVYLVHLILKRRVRILVQVTIYIVCFGLVEMTISTEPAVYRILYENTGPDCNLALQQRVNTSQANPRRFVLFCFVLFCFVLFCFVLFCFVLFCFVGLMFGQCLIIIRLVVSYVESIYDTTNPIFFSQSLVPITHFFNVLSWDVYYTFSII